MNDPGYREQSDSHGTPSRSPSRRWRSQRSRWKRASRQLCISRQVCFAPQRESALRSGGGARAAADEATYHDKWDRVIDWYKTHFDKADKKDK